MSRIVTLREYHREMADSVVPTAADLELSQDPEVASRVTVRWLAGNRAEISTTSYVGVISMDSVQIQITPKLAGGELGVLQMIDYATGLSALRHLPAERPLPSAGLHLRDLVCLLLTIECEKLLAHGPRRDYVRHERLMPMLRGRLLVDRQVLRRHGRLDQLECRFDEFDSDIIDNRLCASALDIAARTASTPNLRARARNAAADFVTFCSPGKLDAKHTAALLSYQRHNEHYRPAHQWALLLLGAGGFDNLYSNGANDGRTFLLDMNTLFEQFVTRLLQEATAGTDFTVYNQLVHRGIICDESTARSYAAVIPDILLAKDRWRRPVDVKYKMYDDRKIDSSDLYQTFLYGYALSGDGSVPSACIIYPGSSGLLPTELSVRRLDGSIGARLSAVTVDIPEMLDPHLRSVLLPTLLTYLVG